MSGDVAVFSRYLRDLGQDYLLWTDDSGDSARVRFVGRFQGAEVVWDCRFVTLQHERRRLAHAGEATRAASLRNFIDIGAPGPSGTPVRVGLDIPCIEVPAVLKMIVMMRNYKRLKPGRHEFGAASPGA